MAKGGKREGAGRPKGKPNLDKREFIEMITDKDVNDSIEVLRSCLKDKDNKKLAIDSATYLLDQRFGKARQKLDADVKQKLEIIRKDFTDED